MHLKIKAAGESIPRMVKLYLNEGTNKKINRMIIFGEAVVSLLPYNRRNILYRQRNNVI